MDHPTGPRVEQYCPMTTLTRAKNMTRVAGIGLGIAVVLLLVAKLSLSLIFSINANHQKAKNQTAQSAPTVAFGQISAPQLTVTNVTTDSITPQLDLVSGDLPQSSPSAKVYKVATPSLTLTAQDRARQTGAALGFSEDPTQPNPVTFVWQDPWRQLTIDLTSQTFSLTTDLTKVDFSQRSDFTHNTNPTIPLTAYTKNLFKYTDMQFSAPQWRYVNPANSGVLPQPETATNVTNFIQATFLRNDLNTLPFYDASGKFGPITMVIIPPMTTAKTNQIKLDQIVQFSSHYFPINTDKPASYPIISSQLAFQQLQSAFSRYLVIVEPTGTVQAKSLSDARVLFARLVYLEPNAKNMQYVQPVWMFEGSGTTNVGQATWVAYVPAIDQDATTELLNQK